MNDEYSYRNPNVPSRWFRNRKGEPISLLEWARLMNDEEYRFLRNDIAGPYRVITVWEGMSRYGDDLDRPVIFWTGYFKEDRFRDETGSRTEEEALLRHEAVLAGLKLNVEEAAIFGTPGDG